MADYVYFEQALLDLQEEAFKHPPLILLFSNMPTPPDVGESLAHIAHYVGIPVDEVMDKKQIIEFADLLTRKLYEMRTGLLVTTLH